MKIDKEFLSGRLLFRENNSHKGDYGHLYLVCGCDVMPGAASLATAAALRSGCGLVTLHTSAYAAQICAVSNPSAILSIDPEDCFSDFEKDLSRYSAVAVGPGLGRHPLTVAALSVLIANRKEAGISWNACIWDSGNCMKQKTEIWAETSIRESTDIRLTTRTSLSRKQRRMASPSLTTES